MNLMDSLYPRHEIPVDHTPEPERPVEVKAQPTEFATFALSVPEFYRYTGHARRLGQLDAETETIVRDTWIAAFKAGCKFAVERTAALSRPDVIDAINVLAEAMRNSE